MSQRPRNAREDSVIRRPETKSFILTSEFWVAAGAAAAVFLGGYALDDIAKTTAWRYGTWIAIAYIISRGIAKAGSQRAYQPDPVAARQGFWGDGRDDRTGDPRYANEKNAPVEVRPVAADAPAREPVRSYEDGANGR